MESHDWGLGAGQVFPKSKPSGRGRGTVREKKGSRVPEPSICQTGTLSQEKAEVFPLGS